MNGELMVSGSSLFAGILLGVVVTILGVLFFLAHDFIFARRTSREDLIAMFSVSMVFGITQTYFETSIWFDMIQTVFVVIVVMVPFYFLKKKYEGAREYFNYIVWDFSTK